MQRLYGLELRLPEGRSPDFHARIIREIAAFAEWYDEHEELLALNSAEDAGAAMELLGRHGARFEPCELLAAPESQVSGTGRLNDFAVVTRRGNVLFDAAYVAAFRLTEERPGAEPAPAVMQLAEHVIAEVVSDGTVWRIIERHLGEWAERTARAYGCGVKWREDDSL
jgi:hypothetical protein